MGPLLCSRSSTVLLILVIIWGIIGQVAAVPVMAPVQAHDQNAGNGNLQKPEGGMRNQPFIEPYFLGFYNSTQEGVPLIMALRNPNSIAVALDVNPSGRTYNTSLPRVTIMASQGALEEYDKADELMKREDGCRLACVDHGHCDEITHFCICEPFWTQNPFRLHLHRFETNCDWNVFVVIGTLVGISFGLLIFSILCHACCRRMEKKETPAHRRYRLLNDDDMEGFGKLGAGMRVPKRAQLADSDEEASETVFEAKNPKYYAHNQYGNNVPVKATEKK